MAQRLATDYVKACLQLTEAEMLQLMAMFADHQVALQTKVCDNGNQEVVFHEEAGREIVLSFERKDGVYIFEGSCRLNDTRLVNAMKQAVAMFRGDALVHRIFASYTMEYTYRQGKVAKIVELKQQSRRIVFVLKDTLGDMERLFLRSPVEQEIGDLRMQINTLLDHRNKTSEEGLRREIDVRLEQLAQQLFVREA